MNNIVTPKNDLPAQDFLVLGLRELAYVKPIAVGDGEGSRLIFAIHTANGAAVGAAETKELAFEAIRENGLEPVHLH
ncbi:MAG: DUF1150 family protein [Alphaproteobacteria bacterium]|nr:DUF1150 family protein [Alphaproteobacteria bacterium]